MITYPVARKDGTVDNYHGVQVPDPYRWLEDPDTPEAREWIDAENRLTFGFLERIAVRDRIKDRLTKLWDHERFGQPHKKGGRYFYQRNDGLQNQDVLYFTSSLEGEPRVLLDPNTLSADGTVALSTFAISEDGKLMAYALASAGSDWTELHVREVDTGQDRADLLRWVKFSGAAWTHDGLGFFYGRYPEPPPGATLEGANYFNKLYYHRLGTPQSQDELVYERPDQKEWSFHPAVSEDGRYLVITVAKGTDPNYQVFYKDLEAKGTRVLPIIDRFEAEYAFVGNRGPVFWFKTNLEAPRGRVIAIDVRRPERAGWTELVPQAAETIEDVSAVGGRFVISYLKDAHTEVRRFALDGAPAGTVDLPGLGAAGGFRGRLDDPETFYSYTSFTTPTTVYRHDLETGASTVYRQPQVAFDPSAFETRQVFFASRDGTRVPMFIVHRRGLVLDGTNPTYLYGYGGFNIPMTPAFSVSLLTWMEMGGVFAMPGLRGGGEYGEDWHQAGVKLRKQNVFDDFIAAAEWLIANRYTSTPRLAIGGGSNGGLLVGACMTQRPELFGAVVAQVGVLDMLRFHKFTIGWAWVDDYGSSDDPEQFRALLAYSPLHNLRPGTAYPATLIATADHDDRVVPAHSFKFAAALQAAQAGPAPVLIRIETRAGHGAGKPTTKKIEELADQWAFLVEVLNVTPR